MTLLDDKKQKEKQTEKKRKKTSGRKPKMEPKGVVAKKRLKIDQM